MKSQEHIDDLIKVILTAEEKESVSNQMVGEVLEFLNENNSTILPLKIHKGTTG